MPAIPITTEDLENRFAYHPPVTREKQQAHEQARAACLDLAKELVGLMPPGREASLAITNLEQTMMWANAAIARYGVAE